MVAISCQASAALVVSNTGPLDSTTPSFRIGGPNTQVEAVVWAQAATTSSTITATIGGIDSGTVAVDAYLIFNTQNNVIASTTVNVGSVLDPSGFNPVTIFSGLDLQGGFYALVLFNTDISGETQVRWAVGTTTNNTDAGEYFGSSFANSTNGTPNFSKPYLSNFRSSSAQLEFSVDGTLVTPEPSTLALAAMGGLGVAFRAIRRRQTV